MRDPLPAETQTLIVARLRKRGDAEDDLNILRRLMPDGCFELMFDPETEPTVWVADPASRTYSGDIPPAVSNYDQL